MQDNTAKIIPLNLDERVELKDGDGDDNDGGKRPPACGDCRHRIGLLGEPWTWHCAIAGYSVKRERWEYGADEDGTFCGGEGAWWQPRESTPDVKCAPPLPWWQFWKS